MALRHTQCVHVLSGHTGGVWCCAFEDGLLVSGSTDHTLRVCISPSLMQVWDMVSGRCVHVLAGHTSTVRCVRTSRGLAVSGARDASLRVWSLRDGVCLRVLAQHTAPVRWCIPMLLALPPVPPPTYSP